MTAAEERLILDQYYSQKKAVWRKYEGPMEALRAAQLRDLAAIERQFREAYPDVMARAGLRQVQEGAVGPVLPAKERTLENPGNEV